MLTTPAKCRSTCAIPNLSDPTGKAVCSVSPIFEYRTRFLREVACTRSCKRENYLSTFEAPEMSSYEYIFHGAGGRSVKTAYSKTIIMGGR